MAWHTYIHAGHYVAVCYQEKYTVYTRNLNVVPAVYKDTWPAERSSLSALFAAAAVGTEKDGFAAYFSQVLEVFVKVKEKGRPST